MSSWGGRPTEDMMWSAPFTDDTEWNEAAWGNLVQTDSTVRFNELVRSASSELDAEKRKSMYWEAQALCNYDGGAIVYAFNQYVGAGSKKLAHGEDVAVTGKVTVTNFLNVGGLHKILIFFVAHLNAPHYFQ